MGDRRIGRWAGGRISRVRNGRFRWYLERRVGNRRVGIALDVESERQALAELALFERDPVAYLAAREPSSKRVVTVNVDESRPSTATSASRSAPFAIVEMFTGISRTGLSTYRGALSLRFVWLSYTSLSSSVGEACIDLDEVPAWVLQPQLVQWGPAPGGTCGLVDRPPRCIGAAVRFGDGGLRADIDA